MTRGRKPKASSEHLRDGTFRPDRHSAEFQREPGMPDKPLWLSPQGSLLWDQEFPNLCGQWILYKSDSYLLGQFFEACAIAVLARRSMYCENPDDETMGLHGAVTAKPNNFTGELELKKHPGITAWKDAVTLMKSIASDMERRGAREHPEASDDDAPPVFTSIDGGKL
jgi:phage terminase small subunit